MPFTFLKITKETQKLGFKTNQGSKRPLQRKQSSTKEKYSRRY